MYKKELLNQFAAHGYVEKSMINGLAAKCTPLLSPAEIVTSEGYCSPEEALEVMGEYYGLPVSHVDSFEIDRSLLEKFSRITLTKNRFLPISISNGVLTVAICCPTDFIALSAIKMAHSGPISYVLVSEEQLINKIQSFAASRSTSNVLRDLKETTQEEPQETSVVDEVQNAPAVKLVDSLINEAISFRASDIHIEPFEKTVRVRYRIDGSLHERAEFPIDSYPAICARLKILAGINIAERRIPQDGRINMVINDVEYDFRVSTLPTVHGEKFVVRILDKTAFNFTREELGFTQKENAVIDKILAHPHGIVLLTGPTGCGKSTTLYSFLKELNKVDVNIVTVEDPVEYTLQGINQTQVNTKANMTFANALRSILRQDPNIVMIGEIRDEETAQIAIRAAITGHLVFSTLHTNDAPGSINRLIDMGVEPYLVADAVVGVIAQRLVKKLCPQCKTKIKATPAEAAMLKLTGPVEIYQPCGCPFCNNTGYKGRTAVHEIMYLNDKIRYAINDRAYLENLRDLSIENGMTPLWEACRELVLDGTTSLSELMSLFTE
ncbi:MAG: type II/IV secretion system protein [Clostridiales bacterium]|nr:type II/IV secretion system protein [Clostridiales bacterium]